MEVNDMGLIAVGAGLAMGLAALGVGIGQGIVANGAMNGISRQPEIGGKLVGNMILAMAIMETALVLAFVVAVILLGKM
jgi:F0F1-type ATP synthase, subunit c/Archaeal/vacuolar-type H+-ATPase, subunit K